MGVGQHAATLKPTILMASYRDTLREYLSESLSGDLCMYGNGFVQKCLRLSVDCDNLCHGQTKKFLKENVLQKYCI